MRLLSVLRSVFGGAKYDDAEAEQLRQARLQHRAELSPVIHPRADVDVARRLVVAGLQSDALADLQSELDQADAVTAREFPQCTAAELRGLAAMRRSELHGVAAMAVRGTPAEAAYSLMAHAWWLCGLASSADRGAELRDQRQRIRWEERVGLGNAAQLVDLAVTFKPLRTAADVERLSAALWALADLPAKDRLRT